MIRLANKEDYESIIGLIKNFHFHSPYRELDVDYKKVSQLIDKLFDTPKQDGVIILLDIDDICGILIGQCGETIFNTQRLARELIWWVNENKRGKESIKMLDTFLYWAKEIAKADLVQLTSVNSELADMVDKVYTRKGFKLIERNYIARI